MADESKAGGGKESVKFQCNQAKAAYRQMDAEYKSGLTDSIESWESFASSRGLDPSVCTYG